MGDANDKKPMSPRAFGHGFTFEGLGQPSAGGAGPNEGVDRRSYGENSSVYMDRGGGNTFNLNGPNHSPLLVFGNPMIRHRGESDDDDDGDEYPGSYYFGKKQKPGKQRRRSQSQDTDGSSGSLAGKQAGHGANTDTDNDAGHSGTSAKDTRGHRGRKNT